MGNRNPWGSGSAGAVVIGGDYQGLGIVRSLGRRGIPVCVIDDELNISRFSRYTWLSLRVPDLKDPGRTVESLREAGRSHGLEGWVLYPTRDEIVGAISRGRAELSAVFRVPTPGWESVRIAWDKRKTHELAERLGIPSPRTLFARSPTEAAGLDLRYPVAVKPAIKEHFFYAARVKALRADCRQDLQEIFRRVCTVIPPEEAMLQEIIPGEGSSSTRTAGSSRRASR